MGSEHTPTVAAQASLPRSGQGPPDTSWPTLRAWLAALGLLWALLLWPQAAAAQSPAPGEATAIGSVALLPDAPVQVIAGQVQVLEDPLAVLDNRQVLQQRVGWRTQPADAIRLGPSLAAYWLRVRLHNAGDDHARFVLSLGSVRQDHVRWLMVDRQGRIELEQDTGDRLPRSTRLIDTHSLALPLALAAGDWRDVYVRIRAHDGLIEPMPLQVSADTPFHDQERARLALLGLYGGALLALLLYNLFLYTSTRSIEFAGYVTYVGGLLLWNLAYYGIGFEWFWRDQPILNHQLPLIGGAIAHAGAWWFVPAYLRLHERTDMRRIVRAYRLAAWGHLACIPLALADQYTLGTFAAFAVGMPMLLFTPWLAWRLARQGQREAVFLGMAITWPVLAIVVFYGQLFGWLPYSTWGTYSIQIGSFIEMCLLAFGLADSMNALKAQKLAAERALSHSLEQQVAERTLALELANQRLRQLAVTDELTGAFNRRHFNVACATALGPAAAHAPVALIMFDLDHFKRYNDHHGHQAGDHVLGSVAGAVGGALQAQGELFRLGGEEFAVLITAEGPAHAHRIAEALRASIQALDIPHAGSPAGRVTASFGVLWCGAGGARPSAKEAYAAADAALYEAKASGRDRVVLCEHVAPAQDGAPLEASNPRSGQVEPGHGLAHRGQQRGQDLRGVVLPVDAAQVHA